MLTVNAPLPEGDDAARAVGRDRFQRFVEHVGRRLAAGRLTLLPEDDE
jgi:putative hemolysin